MYAIECWKGDRQDATVFAWCCRCGGEVYALGTLTDVGGHLICLDCLADLLAELRRRREEERGREV